MDRTNPQNVTINSIDDIVRLATVAVAVPGAGAASNATLGTGFFVAPGVVATCAHVVAPDENALPKTVEAVSVEAGKTFNLVTSAEFYFRHESGVDLAYLRMTEDVGNAGLPYVLMSANAVVGDEMWTYGHPDGRF